MKTYRKSRRTQAFSQWLTACIILVTILMAMFVIINMSNEPVNQPAPLTSDTYIPPVQSLESSFSSAESSFTETSTTTTASTTTASTTAATTAATVSTSASQVSAKKCRITAEYANIRSGPGASFDYIRQVFNGESYTVLGQAEAANGILWYQIDLGGGVTGYVCSAFVDYAGTASDTSASIVPGGEAYLTFDDGPSSNTPKILDILDRYGVKATFFVIYHKGQEDTYRAIVERGHTLALHSYTHTYKDIYSSQTAFFNDLDKLSDYVSSITGVTPMIMRFPGGSSNTVSKKYCEGIMSALTKEVEARGYSYHDWNVDSGDADASTVDKDVIVKNVRARLGSYSRAVILMHDAKSKTTTVEALPEIIEHLLSRGYTILPITGSTPPVHHRVNN